MLVFCPPGARTIMKRTKPEIIELDANKLEELLQRAEGALDEEDYKTIRAVIESYLYISDLVDDKNTSIHRLRKLLFGDRTEKTASVIGSQDDVSSEEGCTETAESTHDESDPNHSDSDNEPPEASKGHGRNGADAYSGAERIKVPHESFEAGDACPKCGQGTIYEMAEPGVLIRIVGQAPLQATVYELQKFRCDLCGKVVTAESPEGVGPEKYDATAASMIASLKYGSGLPFNRLEGLQENLEIPLPAATQWDIVRATANELTPIYSELIRQASHGSGEQVLDFSLQDRIGFDANGVKMAFFLQQTVKCRIGKGRITTKSELGLKRGRLRRPK